MLPEEKAIDLQDLAKPLIQEIFSLLKGEVTDKGPLAAELARRMAIYAARGDQAGMGLVIGRAAAAVQASKLEAEASFEKMLNIAGAFLFDVAENFLPRLIGQLERRVLGGE